MGHAGLGVTHGSWRIAFDRPEISLAVDQRLTHRPRLSHVNESRINHGFTVGVIVTAGITANLRALTMLPARKERQIVHCVENSALGGLEPVSRIGQRPRNNNRHRVVEERPRHFLGYIYWINFLVS